MSRPSGTAPSEYGSEFDYSRLLERGRIDSTVYRSEHVFERELARIWRRCWIYVGHDSEVPNPGDYVRREVGFEPVILIHGNDQQVRVLLNRCPHRGNLVCSHPQGSSKILRCAYHSWTFDATGELIGTPFPEAYGDRVDEFQTGLTGVPRLESYRGFVFVNFDRNARPLKDYLGAAADYIDRFADLAPDGELDLSAGRLQVKVAGNWKLAVENNTDGYHPAFLHRSVLSVKGYLQKAMDQTSQDPIVVRDIGGGHSMIDYSGQNRATGFVGQSVNAPLISDAVRADYVARVAARTGTERARELIASGTWPVNIFPNLMITWQDVRTITPVSVHESVLTHTPALLKGAPSEINLARLRQEVESYGPAGCVGADDVEMYDRSQVAFGATVDTSVRLGRGLDSERVDASGVLTGGPTDETALRAFWRHYRDLMLETQGGPQ